MSEKAVRMNNVFPFDVQLGKSRVFFNYCKLNNLISVFLSYFIHGFVKII